MNYNKLLLFCVLAIALPAPVSAWFGRTDAGLDAEQADIDSTKARNKAATKKEQAKLDAAKQKKNSKDKAFKKAQDRKDRAAKKAQQQAEKRSNYYY